MKVVIQNTSRVWGGNEKWLATLASGLVARGHQVVVSCRRGGVVSSPVLRSVEARSRRAASARLSSVLPFPSPFPP